MNDLLTLCVAVEDELDESFCHFYDEDDCRFAFVYSFDEKGKVIIKAQQERECPPQVYVLGMSSTLTFSVSYHYSFWKSI